MLVDLSAPTAYATFQDLYSKEDEVFILVGNFNLFVEGVLPEIMVPPFVNVGEAVMLSFIHLKIVAKHMQYFMHRYELTVEGKVSRFVELSYSKAVLPI